MKIVRVADKKAVTGECVPEKQKWIENLLGGNSRILLREIGMEPVVRVMVKATMDEICHRYVDEMFAMSIFLLVNRLEVKPNKFILAVSECTWGIYLLHPLFINIAIKALKIDSLTSLPYVKLFVFTIIIFIVSLIATYLLRKLPIVKKLF